MNAIVNIILAVQMLTALGMIGLILIQHGKGADIGAAFGSGSAGSLFGASGSANFLSRSTAALATVFFVATLALAYFGNQRPASTAVVRERKLALPLAPNRLPELPLPNAAPMSAPLPCWIRIRPIIARAVSICTASTTFTITFILCSLLIEFV